MDKNKDMDKTNDRDTTSSDKSLEERRSAVRKILAAGSVTAAAAASTWKTPIVDSVVLPAHAQATGPAVNSVITGQIGASQIGGLLDLFLSPAYADEGSDLVGGCVDITINGSTVTATVTLNTTVSDTKSGTLGGCGFTVGPVNGYTVEGEVDDPNNPTTCEGYVGPLEFSAVLNGSCSVVPPTTDDCVPTEGSSCPT